MMLNMSNYCRRCGTHESHHDGTNSCPEFEYQLDSNFNPNLDRGKVRKKFMADKKPTAIQMLMAEAKAELLKDNKKKWLKEITEKLKTLERAKKVVANCEREIEDLEVRINEELA